jgi:hypothetical protein
MTTDTLTRIVAVSAACAGLVTLPGCGDTSVGPPEPGTVAVMLATPNLDDGAILFRLEGGSVEALTAAAPSHRLFSRATGAASATVVVVGNLVSGAVLVFDVPDVTKVSDYRATILEVAARDNSLRSSLAGYSLEVQRD